jgi:hypothetical protein
VPPRLCRRTASGLALLSLLITASLAAQPALWTELADDAATLDATAGATSVATHLLHVERLSAMVRSLPPGRTEAEGARSTLVVPLPLGGGYEEFEVEEVPVLAPDLARRYPSIRTLAGHSLRDPLIRVRLTVAGPRLHARIFAPFDVFVVVAAEPADDLYVAGPETVLRSGPARSPETPVARRRPPPVTAAADDATPRRVRIEDLTTFRLAVATTASFAAALSARMGAVDREDVLSIVATAVNAVDEVFERDLGVRLQLVADNDALIFVDSRDEPFAASDGEQLLDQSQVLFDCVLGAQGYDVGHTLNAEGWSLAYPGTVGSVGWKGRGATGVADPGSNLFDLVYFGHELGHQFGAGHTFTGTLGECNEEVFAPDSAVEPGSGTTLMSYAGLCGDDDVPPSFEAGQSDVYFHARSIEQIDGYLLSTEVCQPVRAATGNRAPVIDAGLDLVVPRGTPFELEPATATDDQPLLFNWEQVNAAAQRMPRGTTCCEAFYVSVPPHPASRVWNTSPDRCPRDCELEFALTARDGHTPGGGVAIDRRSVTVLRNAGPFVVDEPTRGSEHSGSIEVRWRVAGTDTVMGVEEVRLRLICGETVLTETTTRNDGGESWDLSDIECASAEVEIAPAQGHVFYATSSTFVLTAVAPEATSTPP